MTEQLHFSIEGEFLTNHFREICLSGEWSKAVSQLQESLIGIPLDNVLEILSGEKKLIGVNDLELVDDNDSEDYIKDLLFTYSKYVYKSGSWFKVKAILNTIKEHDSSNYSDKNHVSSRIKIYFPYFDDYTFVKGVCCILEKVDLNPPVWLEKKLRTNEFVNLEYIPEIGFIPNEIEFYDNEDTLLREIIYDKYSDYEAEDIIYSDAFTSERMARERIRSSYLDNLYHEEINDLRVKILEQAEKIGGFMTISDKKGNTYRVPKALSSLDFYSLSRYCRKISFL